LHLNHKRTTSSLVPPIFYVAKHSAIKIKVEGSPLGCIESEFEKKITQENS